MTVIEHARGRRRAPPRYLVTDRLQAPRKLRPKSQTETETKTQNADAYPQRVYSSFCRSVAMEVGIEPTDELPHHTLSSTARDRPLGVRTVRHVLRATFGDGGGQCRTEVNETKTETSQPPVAATAVVTGGDCSQGTGALLTRLLVSSRLNCTLTYVSVQSCHGDNDRIRSTSRAA
jgi:hypothetical protein